MSLISTHLAISLVAGSLISVLMWGPASLQESLLRVCSMPKTQRFLVTALKWVLVLGLTANANALLAAWARNNWLFFSNLKPWKWDEEVAVITGGSNGIGALVVKGLASRGSKVAVLDVQPLPKELEELDGVSFFKCDITSPDEVKQVAEAM